MPSRPCETTTTVRPLALKSVNFSRHFAWKSMSPTARTSSTRSTSGSVWIDTAKPRRTYIPLE
ncbi:hypothetical protein ACFPRL_11380 [Pseudoclavibacter helvolus]